MPYKVCSNCQENNGVRTLSCKKCGCAFIPKIQSNTPNKRKRGIIKTLVTNWKEELSKGDIVKLIQGTGSYYLLENGERHYFSSGIVKVGDKEQNGFWAVHNRLKHNKGYFFVYMGHKCRSPVIDNLVRQRHKIFKLSNIPERMK